MFIKRGDGQIISVFDADEFLEKDSKKQKGRIKKGIDFGDDDTLDDELLIPEDEDQGEDE
jgi:hypothetical protein